MATIKAPFNFVPVSDNVFFPDWAKQISHDIPFSDGESGVINLTITAESPIFVRNGHTKEEAAKNDNYRSFSKVGDKYFIPATSIKGAIRNVLEIMSFGKMRLDKNAMFAQREWGNTALYTIKNPREQQNLSCGYLHRKGSSYEIIDCGKPYRIGHDRIDSHIGCSVLSDKFCQNSHFNINQEVCENGKTFDPKTAAYKYHLLNRYDSLFNVQKFSLDEERCNEYQSRRVVFNNSGDINGRLVLTGSPDKWMFPRPTAKNPRAGKFYEFVFKENGYSQIIPFSEDEFNHFKFIYSESTEWSRAKQLLEKEGIPVFFRKNGNRIKDLGMAFLYKLPYENSPFDTLKDDHKQDGKNGRKYKADFADCLFGFTDNSNSLKGRVQISHAFSETKVVPVTKRIVTLGSPKASYYPLYVKQNTDANGTVVQYATYNAQGQISGWKRYMIRKSVWGTKTQDEYNPQLDSILLPLDNNTEFTFKISYHNLKKIELGALLSAITFHNTKDCRYQLGQGKPYGFGVVKIEITNILDDKLCDYLYEFEKVMEKHNVRWANSPQIKELITITSKPATDNNSSQFEYLRMNNTPEQNEFLSVKGGLRGDGTKEGLRNYSSIIGATTDVKSLYSEKIQQEYEDLINKAKSLLSEAKYNEAKKISDEAEEFLPQKKREDSRWAEINRIIEQQQEEEIKRKKKEKDEEIRIAKVEGGLSFLEEKYPDGIKYKVQDFKGVKNRIEQWMKKANVRVLPEEQRQMFRETLSRLYQQPNKEERELWKDFNSSIWKTIKSYIGEDEANKWFYEIIK
jgi:CRISPR-associated protein (TIGR03986 family)